MSYKCNNKLKSFPYAQDLFPDDLSAEHSM